MDTSKDPAENYQKDFTIEWWQYKNPEKIYAKITIEEKVAFEGYLED